MQAIIKIIMKSSSSWRCENDDDLCKLMEYCDLTVDLTSTKCTRDCRGYIQVHHEVPNQTIGRGSPGQYQFP